MSELEDLWHEPVVVDASTLRRHQLVIRKMNEDADALGSRIHSLTQMIKSLIPYAEYSMAPTPHAGSCGPEAGCDCVCVDNAHTAETIREARRLIGG